MAKSAGRSNQAGKPAPARALRARSVGDLLPEVGGVAFRRFGFVQSSVVSRWREIVGARYAGVSAPESIKFPPGKRSDGVLTLVVESAHAPVMQHVAPEIVERVNRFFGYQAVARVAFRQGMVRLSRGAARKAPPPIQSVPAEIGDSLRAIADPELRQVMESLAQGIAARDGAPSPPVQTLNIPVIGKIRG